MTTRQIQSDPRELWYLALPSKLKPNMVEMILRSASGGDIWQQWQLFTRMLDSWVMLRKCCNELQSAVSQTKYTVRPFALTGQEPSREAIRRADFCSSLLQRMKPDPITDEKGFAGMVYHLTNAYINGISMVEILWDDAGSKWRPRATAFVHPRHYTFTTGGKLVIVDGNYTDYRFPDPDKFIVAQYSAHSGSSLSGGILRPLAWWWSAMMYNREWMLEYAQRFGQPFRWSTYKPGTPDTEITKINDNLKNMGASAWASFVEGATVNFEQPGALGPQQPQMAIMQTADRACQLLILGQTLTTDVADSGSRALGDVHEGVRRERVEDLAKWIGHILTEQLCPAILRANFGDDSECPTVEPEFTQTEDPLKTAQRFQIILGMGIPVNAEQACRELDLEMCEEGDKVFLKNKFGILGSTDEEIQAVSQAPEPFGQSQFPQNGNGNGNGNGITAREIVMAQEPGKRHVLPNFRARLADLREARQEDFKLLLDRLKFIESIDDADDLKASIDKLSDDLPIIANKAMANGETSKVVADMLAGAFIRGLAKAHKRNQKARLTTQGKGV